MNDSLEQLIKGYREFRSNYVGKQYAAYRTWASSGQSPRVMMIACSDSRVNPAILTHSGLGEIFVVNNVANLVPPYKEGKNTHHSTSAALEFAVCNLKVEHIIVLGHSRCGGIAALMDGITRKHENNGYSFIEPWMDIVSDAKEYVLREYPNLNAAEQKCHCEKEALLISLANFNTFPWIKKAKEQQKLQTHAWYFNIESGDLERYDSNLKEFTLL